MGDPKSDDDPVFLDDSSFRMTPVSLEAAVPAGAGVRPKNLTFVCVLAIVLAGMGLLTGCSSIISLVFASGMQQGLAGMPGGANQPAADMQKEMNARMMAVAGRYQWLTIPLMIAKLFVEAALLAGAIMTLGLKPRGRSWLQGALCAAIVLESISIVPGILITRETQAVMTEMMPKAMAAQQGPNAPAGINDFMSTFFSAIGIVSLIIALGWLVAKLVFYVLGIRYLRQPEVQAPFAPSANAVARDSPTGLSD